jgi:hypothetical protein
LGSTSRAVGHESEFGEQSFAIYWLAFMHLPKYIAAGGRVSAGFSLWCLRRADSAHAEIEEVYRNGAQVQPFIRSGVLHVHVK